MRKIPIQNVAAQTFNVQIPEEEKAFTFTITYIARGEYFVCSIETSENEILSGLKLVSGIPLLKAFNITQGDFIVINSAEYTGDPVLGSWDNLTELFYITPEELELLNV